MRTTSDINIKNIFFFLKNQIPYLHFKDLLLLVSTLNLFWLWRERCLTLTIKARIILAAALTPLMPKPWRESCLPSGQAWQAAGKCFGIPSTNIHFSRKSRSSQGGPRAHWVCCCCFLHHRAPFTPSPVTRRWWLSGKITQNHWEWP